MTNNHNVDYKSYRFKDIGEEFYKADYLRKFDDDEMPHNNGKLLSSIFKSLTKKIDLTLVQNLSIFISP